MKSRPQARKRECHTVGCSRTSHLNHLLQKNGILTQITTQSHVYELRTNRFEEKALYYSLNRLGCGKAMTMYGYCSRCDNALFSPIEVQGSKIPTTQADFCRYSLRPIVHEIGKKEGNVSFMRARDGRAQYFLNRRAEIGFTAWKCEQFNLGSLKTILDVFTQGVTNKLPIHFLVKEIPKIEICASSMYIEPSKQYLYREDIQVASKSFKGLSFATVNIFPVEDTSYLVFGTHKDAGDSVHELMSRIDTATIDDLTKLVSNMLIAQIEDWCISEKLYKKLPVKFEKIVTRAKKNQFRDFNKDYDINLFHL